MMVEMAKGTPSISSLSELDLTDPFLWQSTSLWSLFAYGFLFFCRSWVPPPKREPSTRQQRIANSDSWLLDYNIGELTQPSSDQSWYGPHSREINQPLASLDVLDPSIGTLPGSPIDRRSDGPVQWTSLPPSSSFSSLLSSSSAASSTSPVASTSSFSSLPSISSSFVSSFTSPSSSSSSSSSSTTSKQGSGKVKTFGESATQIIEMAYWFVKFVGDFDKEFDKLLTSQQPKDMHNDLSKESIFPPTNAVWLKKNSASLVKFARYIVKFISSFEKLYNKSKK